MRILSRATPGLTLAGAASLAVLACAARSRQAPSQNAAGARQQAVADSIELDRASRFFATLQTRSAPLISASNYLGTLNLIDSLVLAAGPSEGVRQISGQMIATYASFLGQYQTALEAFSFGEPRLAPPDTTSLVGYAPESAVGAIAKLAALNQVVFINEAHHVPRHRAFTLALLPQLRALGFSYLAAEGLFESESTLNARKYPVQATGVYTNEPAFGELLRAAVRLGFTLVPYEAVSSTQDGRETGQASNLVERIFRKDPHARVIVHAGYEHIAESGLLAGAKPMAVRFRDMTGIDPLTIDQTLMTEAGDTLHEDPRYRYILRRNAPREPIVLRKGDAVWSAKSGVFDVSVIHPHATYRDGRPDWLWAMEDRRPYPLPANVCAPSAECVVTARIATESSDAVPVDALRTGRGGASRTLALPPGEYVIVTRNAAGAVLGERRVTIER